MPNIKCLGLSVSEKKMFKQIVDARTHARMDDGQTGITKAHLGELKTLTHIMKVSARNKM